MYWPDALAADLRSAALAFRRGGAANALIVAILAVAVAAATVVFSLVAGVLLTALPFPNASRIVTIGAVATPDNRVIRWWDQGQAFTAVAVFSAGGVNFEGSSPRRVAAAVVSSGFFPLLAVSPARGRWILQSEDARGARVVVIADRFWRDELQADPGVLGRPLLLDGREYTIVGVMPPGFDFPRYAELWLPRSGPGYAWLGPAPALQLGSPMRQEAIARLRRGVSLAEADVELALIWKREAKTYASSGVTFGGPSPVARPLRDLVVRSARPKLLMLLGAVLVLLLIAVANSAGLALVRAEVRRREFAIRRCCGASWSRLARTRLLEGLALGVAAAALGEALAWLSLRIVRAAAAVVVPRMREVSLDARVLVFALATALAAGLLTALLPAWRARRFEFEGGFGLAPNRYPAGTPRGASAWLACAQIALAVALIATAALLATSLDRLLRVVPGFVPARAAAFNLSLPAALYRDHRAAILGLQKHLLRSARSSPSVLAAGFANQLPLGSLIGELWINRAGAPTGLGTTGPTFLIAGDYLRALGVPLLRGRSFTAADHQGAPPVCLISSTFARRYWGQADPLGGHIVVDSETREVVGVVGDLHANSLSRPAEPEVYLPMAQPVQRFGVLPLDLTLVVRFRRSLADLPVLRRRLQVASGLPLYHVRSLAQIVNADTAPRRFYTAWLAAFALLALALAVAGTYAIFMQSVAQRTQEMGIRGALGALPAQLMGQIFHEAALLAFAGAPCGLLLAAWSQRFLRGLLYGVRPGNPWILVSAAAVVIVAALAGCAVPAFRAARIDPAVALRRE